MHRDETDCEELVKLAFLNISSTYIALLKKDIAWYNEIYQNNPKTNQDFQNDPQQNYWPYPVSLETTL